MWLPLLPWTWAAVVVVSGGAIVIKLIETKVVADRAIATTTTKTTIKLELSGLDRVATGATRTYANTAAEVTRDRLPLLEQII